MNEASPVALHLVPQRMELFPPAEFVNGRGLGAIQVAEHRTEFGGVGGANAQPPEGGWRIVESVHPGGGGEAVGGGGDHAGRPKHRIGEEFGVVIAGDSIVVEPENGVGAVRVVAFQHGAGPLRPLLRPEIECFCECHFVDIGADHEGDFVLLPGAKRGDGVVADEVTVDNGAEAGIEVEEFPAAP